MLFCIPYDWLLFGHKCANRVSLNQIAALIKSSLSILCTVCLFFFGKYILFQ